MVIGIDERKLIKLTKRFSMKLIFGSVYLKKTKRENDKIMQINF